MIDFRCVKKVADLPVEWNSLADNYFQQTAFLSHTEIFNPCQQRYYLYMEDDKLIAAAIVYTLRVDMLTYVKIKSPFKMHIVGIPCSVSGPGIFGISQAVNALKKHIYEVEKGFVLFLNLEEKPTCEVAASGNTLPTVVMSNHFSTWNEYLASLRTGYRRRLSRINQVSQVLRFEKTLCAAFTEEMHRQYLEVYKKSNGKLEKLGFDFFKQLPIEFILTACYLENIVIGWNIALSNNNKYYFFLGGIDYKVNKTYNTYLRLLSEIVKDGIEHNAEFIELGQTAEIPKMRMGGKPVILYMEAHHNNLILNKLLKLFSSFLEYKRKPENAHPVKMENA